MLFARTDPISDIIPLHIFDYRISFLPQILYSANFSPFLYKWYSTENNANLKDHQCMEFLTSEIHQSILQQQRLKQSIDSTLKPVFEILFALLWKHNYSPLMWHFDLFKVFHRDFCCSALLQLWLSTVRCIVAECSCSIKLVLVLHALHTSTELCWDLHKKALVQAECIPSNLSTRLVPFKCFYTFELVIKLWKIIAQSSSHKRVI